MARAGFRVRDSIVIQRPNIKTHFAISRDIYFANSHGASVASCRQDLKGTVIMSGEEGAVPQIETPAVADAPLGEPMDLMTALQLVLRKSLAHGAKVIEKHTAQLCVLAEDCNQPDYVKLVKALCADHKVNLLSVPSAKTLGEWAGLCKIDSEGKARKVVGCSCIVVKDFGEDSEALNVVHGKISETTINLKKRAAICLLHAYNFMNEVKVEISTGASKVSVETGRTTKATSKAINPRHNTHDTT
uniref:40S ribosomal protein S12 n=1 Tax=Salix viminalis TaxID=40686 RepID=A0A6N2MKR9_SALVM